jgi:hypothetical protein
MLSSAGPNQTDELSKGESLTDVNITRQRSFSKLEVKRLDPEIER